jgi:imidazole glycerol-phosphate synthase subunit HisF
MLKKRLVGVITVRDGWAVQSFAYRRYLPLGRVTCLAENLDRWGVDEILVLCIDRTRRGVGPDLTLLRQLGSLGLSTPLTYGGGICTASQAMAAIQSGAERVCVDAALRAAPAAVAEIAALAGAQAVIGVLPLSFEAGRLRWLDYLTGRSAPLSVADLTLFEQRVASEVLIVDWRNEGRARGFDAELIRRFPLAGIPLIAFGGLSGPEQLDSVLALPQVAAAAVGNFLAYREHAVQKLRQGVRSEAIRAPIFGSGG